MFYLFLRDRLQSKLFFLFTVETEKAFFPAWNHNRDHTCKLRQRNAQMWRNFPPRWRKGWREGNASCSGGGGSSFFAFVVICLLFGFLFLFVSLLLYLAKELIIDKDRLCGLQGSLQPGPLPQILHLHLKVIADGFKTESFFFFVSTRQAQAALFSHAQMCANPRPRLLAYPRVRFFFQFLSGFHQAKRRRF